MGICPTLKIYYLLSIQYSLLSKIVMHLRCIRVVGSPTPTMFKLNLNYALRIKNQNTADILNRFGNVIRTCGFKLFTASVAVKHTH